MNFIYTSSKETNISYADMIALQKDGKIEIGISKALAADLAAKGILPSNKSVKAAFVFWNILAILILLISIYYSFTSKWWYFIVGIIAFFVLASANRDGNSQNYVEQALVDEEFYEKLRAIGALTYKIDSSIFSKLN